MLAMTDSVPPFDGAQASAVADAPRAAMSLLLSRCHPSSIPLSHCQTSKRTIAAAEGGTTTAAAVRWIGIRMDHSGECKCNRNVHRVGTPSGPAPRAFPAVGSIANKARLSYLTPYRQTHRDDETAAESPPTRKERVTLKRFHNQPHPALYVTVHVPDSSLSEDIGGDDDDAVAPGQPRYDTLSTHGVFREKRNRYSGSAADVPTVRNCATTNPNR